MPQVFVACERLDNRAGLACWQLHMLCDTGFSCITSIAADGVQREYGTRKLVTRKRYGGARSLSTSLLKTDVVVVGCRYRAKLSWQG